MRKSLKFKSKAAYERWLAYGNMHHVFKHHTNPSIYIHGKLHKVKHK